MAYIPLPLASWQAALVEWAQTIGGFRIVFANQAANAPTPERPYVRINVLSAKRLGRDGYRDADGTNPGERVRTFYGERLVRLQVTAFAEATGNLAGSAFDIASALASSLEQDEARAPFIAALMGITEIGEVRDLSGARGPAVDGMATFDFEAEAHVEFTPTTPGDFVQQVIGEGTIVLEDASEIVIPFTADTEA